MSTAPPIISACYHFIYGLAHLLRCAVRAGWPLRKIHLLRFKVLICPVLASRTRLALTLMPRCCRWDILTISLTGPAFGVLTRHVYGNQRGGTTGVDLLSFSGFNKVRANGVIVTWCEGVVSGMVKMCYKLMLHSLCAVV